MLATGFDAYAQDGLAAVETESMMEFDPPHLPGHESGARTRNPPAPAPPPTSSADPALAPPVVEASAPAVDWFGENPYWEWSNATGNWGGVRTWFAERGLTFAASYTFDWSSVWSGGVRRRASSRSLFDANLTIDLEKLAGLGGGEVFVDFQSINGRGGSLDAGDTHGISNIQAGRSLDQISELWYQQWMFDRAVRLKIGKVDANSEFAFAESATGFLNSAAGTSTPIFTLPTYPDPSTSINVFVYPTSWLYIGAGIYDGATADGIPTGRNGPATFFSDARSDSWFSIAEAGVTWDRLDVLGAGRLAIGGWTHSADFERFDGGVERGTWGMYLVGEQQLLTTGDDVERGLFAFARYAWTDDDVFDAGQHVGGGLVLKGTFPGRDNDEAGLFVSTLLLSDAAGSSFEGDETALELYYRFSLTPFIHLTPDLQWISNPSGDSTVDNAVVGALRFEVDF